MRGQLVEREAERLGEVWKVYVRVMKLPYACQRPGQLAKGAAELCWSARARIGQRDRLQSTRGLDSDRRAIAEPRPPKANTTQCKRSLFCCSGQRLADPIILLREAASKASWGRGHFPIRGEGPHLLAGFIMGGNGLVVTVRSTTLCLL